MNQDPGFRYLNVAGAWPTLVSRDKISTTNGIITLQAKPRVPLNQQVDRQFVPVQTTSRVILPGPQGPVTRPVSDRVRRDLVDLNIAPYRLQSLLDPSDIDLAQEYEEEGTFLIGALDIGDQSTRWKRLWVTATQLLPVTHLQFFTLSSNENRTPNKPSIGQLSSSGVASTSPDQWRAAPRDALDFLILNQPARYLWIGCRLQGDGLHTPEIHQIRLEYGQASWVRHLPPVYQGEDDNNSFLVRFLALCESLLADEEARIDDLPYHFDPRAMAHNTDERPWLEWLADWLDLTLDRDWNAERAEQALSEAFALHSRRGTVEGLRHWIELYTGATVRIEEPLNFASLWSLPDTNPPIAGAALGVDTMLAPAHVQGAVVGSTATLGQSHLLSNADYGAPLFTDLAHHFCVLVYGVKPTDAILPAKLVQVIEREKPAHTTYTLTFVEPRMRVGVQNRLGIDTIVAGSPAR